MNRRSLLQVILTAAAACAGLRPLTAHVNDRDLRCSINQEATAATIQSGSTLLLILFLHRWQRHLWPDWTYETHKQMRKWEEYAARHGCFHLWTKDRMCYQALEETCRSFRIPIEVIIDGTATYHGLMVGCVRRGAQFATLYEPPFVLN